MVALHLGSQTALVHVLASTSIHVTYRGSNSHKVAVGLAVQCIRSETCIISVYAYDDEQHV